MVVVASGVSGLTVVFAWRNAKTPANTIANPTAAKNKGERRAPWQCYGEHRIGRDEPHQSAEQEYERKWGYFYF